MIRDGYTTIVGGGLWLAGASLGVATILAPLTATLVAARRAWLRHGRWWTTRTRLTLQRIRPSRTPR
jgi:hypothetical protein